MMEKVVKYYYLSDINVVGKDVGYTPYVYKDGWIIDDDNLICDRLMDYEDCSIIDIDEITEQEAMDRIAKLN